MPRHHRAPGRPVFPLVDDLLDVSRITRDMITLQRNPVSLATVVSRAIETARPEIDSRRQVLDVELPDEPIVIEGDESD